MRSRKDWNGASLGQKLAAAAGLMFLHAPVWVIVLYAFTTEDRTYQFPPPGLTLRWFEVAFAREDIWAAMRLSLMVAAVATALAIAMTQILHAKDMAAYSHVARSLWDHSVRSAVGARSDRARTASAATTRRRE